jgi:DNA polymerase-3 subunit alpha
VYVGFRYIRGLQEEWIERVLEERKANGHYLHLQNFIERTGAGLEQLNTLISVGAFRFTGKSKKRLLWEANFIQKKNKAAPHTGATLFEEPPLQFHLPELTDHYLDDRYDEMELLDFTTTNPFVMVDDERTNMCWQLTCTSTWARRLLRWCIL